MLTHALWRAQACNITVEDVEAAIPKYDAKIDCSIKSFSDRKTEG